MEKTYTKTELKDLILTNIRFDILRTIRFNIHKYDRQYETDCQFWLVEHIIDQEFKYQGNFEDIFYATAENLKTRTKGFEFSLKAMNMMINDIAEATLILKELSDSQMRTSVDIPTLWKRLMIKEAEQMFVQYQVTVDSIRDKAEWKYEDMSEDFQEDPYKQYYKIWNTDAFAEFTK